MSYNKYIEVFQKVYQNHKESGFKSYDLCDLKSGKYILWMFERSKHSRIFKFILEVHKYFIRRHPSFIRRLLNIRKKSYVQAQAYISRGLLLMSEIDRYEYYREDACDILTDIYSERNRNYQYPCWGQPYDYWLRSLNIPANTPRTTVTSQVGHTFLDAYDIIRSEKYLERAISIADFFLHEMSRSVDSDNEVCFSYTSIDNQKVHNPNMMASSFLARVGSRCMDSRYTDLAIKCAGYTCRRQNSDGSWYYRQLENDKPSKIDHYHTGYVLESLCVLKEELKDAFPFNTQLNRGVKFYNEQLFVNRFFPKMRNDRTYPLDIQSCAQAIITCSSLNVLSDEYLEKGIGVLDFTIDKMYDENGFFYYQKHQNDRVDKTIYIRWGDSWMLYGISKLVNDMNDINNI